MKSTSFKFIPIASIIALGIINAKCDDVVSKTLDKADIKPALSSKGIDDEEMKLVKAIHKSIIDYAAIKRKTHNNKPQPFKAFEEKAESGVKFEMMPITGGSFTWKGQEKGDSLEVTLSPFWMAKTEVSWTLYDPFLRNPNGIPRLKNGKVEKFAEHLLKNNIDFVARPTRPYHPMTFGMERDKRPAISMTQHAANKFCQWLSCQTGHFYRLPTEAEWEYAANAGSTTKYPWGDEAKQAKEYVWFGGDAGSQYTQPGKLKPNKWGLHDMLGNVQEWTLDQTVSNRQAYFGKNKVNNPWIKATKPYPHVVKGGHWKQKLENISTKIRIASAPKWKATDPQEPKSLWYLTNVQNIGFRVVRPKKIPSAEEMYHYWNSTVAADGKMAVYESDRRVESTIHKHDALKK